MSANPHRGEVEVTLGGKSYVLRPTFEAMAAIERVTGTRLLPLARRFGELDFGLVDIAAIIDIAAVEKPPKGTTGTLVLEAGLAATGVLVAGFLSEALRGGQEGNALSPETTPAS